MPGLVRRLGKDLPGLRGVLHRIDTARSDRDAAVGERDVLLAERLVAQTREDNLLEEREGWCAKCAVAVAERDAARGEQNKLREERDALLGERAGLVAERNVAWAKISDMLVLEELIADGQGPTHSDIPTHVRRDKVPFRCNICGSYNLVPRTQLDREISSCQTCHSTVRFRSVVHLLSRALYGRSVALPDFPINRAIRGVGLSDWSGYAHCLEETFNYQNTYFHQEPRLDITLPPPEMLGSLDFLISTEVFEHVPDPVARAFGGAFAMLKPGGHLVLTVPYRSEGQTIEHYSGSQAFSVVEIANRHCVVTMGEDEALTLHVNPIFHGGAGQTLEMRVFSKSGLITCLVGAGFIDIEVLTDPVPRFGLYFPEPWSLAIRARKPAEPIAASARS